MELMWSEANNGTKLFPIRCQEMMEHHLCYDWDIGHFDQDDTVYLMLRKNPEEGFLHIWYYEGGGFDVFHPLFVASKLNNTTSSCWGNNIKSGYNTEDAGGHSICNFFLSTTGGCQVYKERMLKGSVRDTLTRIPRGSFDITYSRSKERFSASQQSTFFCCCRI